MYCECICCCCQSWPTAGSPRLLHGCRGVSQMSSKSLTSTGSHVTHTTSTLSCKHGWCLQHWCTVERLLISSSSCRPVASCSGMPMHWQRIYALLWTLPFQWFMEFSEKMVSWAAPCAALGCLSWGAPRNPQASLSTRCYSCSAC